jgi:cysteine desulfurase/selenocysteine lyase
MNTNNLADLSVNASPISVAELEKIANSLFFALPNDAASVEPFAQPQNLDAFAQPQIAVLSGEYPQAAQYQKNLQELAKAVPTDDAGINNLIQPQIAALSVEHPRAAQCAKNLLELSTAVSTSPVDATDEAGLANGQLRKLINQYSAANSFSAIHSAASNPRFYFLDEVKPFAGQAQALQFETAHPAFDVHAARRDFPILQERVNGRQLIWLDNAATTQKPQAVIDRLAYFYQHENSNIHRAAHELAARATDAYEGARDIVARFIHASSSDEVVFVRGATEGINLVAQSWGRQNISAGDEIVITWLEHHANIVPWQQLCQQTGAVLKVAPVDDSGQIILSEYDKLLSNKTKLVAITQVSNALGTVTPVREMTAAAHRYGARVLVDGAQGISHLPLDVQSLDCDWYVFSGHKVFAPTGIGVVYGKLDLLNSTQPWQGGGNMIQDVTFEKTLYHGAPARFEAGTGNIADAVGLGAALEYVSKLGIENINRYEHELLVYATKQLQTISGLRLIGTAAEKTSVLSFVLEGFQSTEVGDALNKEGIAVRSGHHCAQPILRRFGVESTVRPSLAFYNTYQEIDVLVSTLKQLQAGKFSI